MNNPYSYWLFFFFFFFHILTSETSQKYNRSIVILRRLLQSVSGRNKCMCCNSRALCCGRVLTCAIHNSLLWWDVILTCGANRADCQGTQTLSNLITQNGRELPIFEGEKNPMLSCFCLTTSFLTHFYLWCNLQNFCNLQFLQNFCFNRRCF